MDRSKRGTPDAYADGAGRRLRMIRPAAILEAIADVSVWITTFEAQSQRSPTRSNHRKRLLQIVQAANLLADALDLRATAANPADAAVGQTMRFIMAQWVAREGDIISSNGLRALAEGAASEAKRSKGGAGSDRVSDRFGIPRARTFCAVAAIHLFEATRRRRPGRTNPDAQRLCAKIWEAAGLSKTAVAERGKTDDGRWERHLGDALGRRDRNVSEAHAAQLETAQLLVKDILKGHGLLDGNYPKRTQIASQAKELRIR
jgi:hypothetical protein